MSKKYWSSGGVAPSDQPVAAPNDVVVTVRVTTAEDIATARKLLAGEARHTSRMDECPSDIERSTISPVEEHFFL